MSRGESLTTESEETPLDSARTRSVLSRVREDGGALHDEGNTTVEKRCERVDMKREEHSSTGQ